MNGDETLRRPEELAGFVGALEHGLEVLADRLAQLEARLEALDASYVRHQDQHEGDVDRLMRAVDQVGQRLTEHEDAHWRSGR